jgi:signal transduction histidine kinase
VETQDDFSKSKPHYKIQIKVEEKEHQNIESMYCLGETSLLKSVISNIIDNACKFSADYKVKLTISSDSANINLIFVDEGVGISPENLKHVFEPFFRGNDTRNIYGHGIGLSLVKRIVDLHKGSIDIESTLGKGTTVIIQLPNTQS